ncbi:formylglycine-generating enzyme family protein [Pseudomonas sp. NPDC090202]|uniref:formylglycine-generating enzyme family protein n=1 Tax=unclassified Pseudomonas TaxID=196821 RepID=UPI00381FFB5C
MNTQLLLIPLLFIVALQGCERQDAPDNNEINALTGDELQAFIKNVKDDLIFVEGGFFLMGDFGPEHSPERLPYDIEKHSKPLHKVELSSFSMSKHKTTNSEFQHYLKFNDLPLRENGTVRKSEWDQMNSIAETPAHADWYESAKYCDWLNEITGLPFSLPTEAQWEYAARSRGQYYMVATDDGTYRAEPYDLVTENYNPKGINISSRGNRIEFSSLQGWTLGSTSPLPVDMFPPNPLGIYSLTDNGLEWVKDWYAPDYYQNSPMKDPQGPDRPVFKNKYGQYLKVMRGNAETDPYWGGGVNILRHAVDPLGRFDGDEMPYLDYKTMRCVVNNPEPIITGR